MVCNLTLLIWHVQNIIKLILHTFILVNLSKNTMYNKVIEFKMMKIIFLDNNY